MHFVKNKYLLVFSKAVGYSFSLKIKRRSMSSVKPYDHGTFDFHEQRPR